MFLSTDDLISRGWSFDMMWDLLGISDILVGDLHHFRTDRVLAAENSIGFIRPEFRPSQPLTSQLNSMYDEIHQIWLDAANVLPAGVMVELDQLRREARFWMDVFFSPEDPIRSVLRFPSNEIDDARTALYLRDLLLHRITELLQLTQLPISRPILDGLMPFVDRSICVNYPDLVDVMNRRLNNRQAFVVDVRQLFDNPRIE